MQKDMKHWQEQPLGGDEKMSSQKNKYDVVQYCLRLNLNIPEHLEVHKILQNLNKKVHKSQSAFMVAAIIRNAANYSDDELLTEAAAEKRNRERFITKEEFEKSKEDLKNELMKEITALLLSSLSNVNAAVQTITSVAGSKRDTGNREYDETLADLSKSWA